MMENDVSKRHLKTAATPPATDRDTSNANNIQKWKINFQNDNWRQLQTPPHELDLARPKQTTFSDGELSFKKTPDNNCPPPTMKLI